MQKFGPYIKENWRNAAKWLLGALLGVVLTKTCDKIWPDSPVIVKEVADTVKFVHSITPLPSETDSLLKEQIRQQILNIELLNKYEESARRIQAAHEVTPCKLINGNPYPNSKGYTQRSSSPYCFTELVENKPFLDITYRFIRGDYCNVVNTLDIKIIRKTEEGNRVLVFDQLFELQKGETQLVRIVDDLSLGDYTIEAGFILKEDINAKYPSFYSQKLRYVKR